MLRHKDGKGYWMIKNSSHPRANTAGYVREHIVIAEAAIGKPLPSTAVVHHVDGRKANNKKSNLVICENDVYHRLLHQRQDIIRAGGDPNRHHKICVLCKLPRFRHEFHSNSRNLNGVRSECKSCRVLYKV